MSGHRKQWLRLKAVCYLASYPFLFTICNQATTKMRLSHYTQPIFRGNIGFRSLEEDCEVCMMGLYKVAGCNNGASLKTYEKNSALFFHTGLTMKNRFGHPNHCMSAWVVLMHIAFGMCREKDIG